MLYIIYSANHHDLSYTGGQGPIIHIVGDLYETVSWAESQGCPWAFTLSNAGAFYTEFRNSIDYLDEIDWNAVEARDFRDPDVKEGKQAEFLLNNYFPWELVLRIGVKSEPIRDQVLQILSTSEYQPSVEVHPEWYF